ncbi:hypothetical protein FA15DRAFT_728773 [Coprinopsis marcescibilis]|uniref:AA9 family lytic polysaccharide monooxygenase n=1 Tax=Coprinopsis marcescibilis TaxID=230819 RepID=A0A5C3KFD5_COPMA|nr:hypothetical protein FA15DRAFT_728773 [Coprinopsis marcescibilis]
MKHHGFFLVAASLMHTALAHMGIYGVWLNGEFRGDGRNVHVRTPASKINSPAGDTFAPEWFWSERGDFYTGNHKGPLLVYIAPAVTSGPNTPNIWTKLYHYAYNTTDGYWSDDYFQKNAEATKGHHFITIPDIPAGDYLVRSEIITLQEAMYDNGAQHYPSCVQIRVKTNGSAVLPGGVSFPGTYVPLQRGLKWGLGGDDPSEYPIPGGPVWEGSPGGGIYKLSLLAHPVSATFSRFFVYRLGTITISNGFNG